MILTRGEYLFLVILIINFAAALLYLLYGMVLAAPLRKKLSRRKNREAGSELLYDNRRTYLIRVVIMILCPVIGILFFLTAQLLYLTIFRFHVELGDVVFDKTRVETQVKASEAQERNIIPIEEAIAINDKKSMRTAMMSIIRGEMQSSLSSVALALEAEDTETAHYAASLLSDNLNEFRMNVRKMHTVFLEEGPEDGKGGELLDYMNFYLKQSVFTKIEQNGFVRMMETVADSVYQKEPSLLTGEQYEGVFLRLLEMEDFEHARKWSERLTGQYPESLCSYTCRLKLHFTMENRPAFFEALDALKKSDVVIDNETLEMIRAFN